jgi:hypothetical protein
MKRKRLSPAQLAIDNSIFLASLNGIYLEHIEPLLKTATDTLLIVF